MNRNRMTFKEIVADAFIILLLFFNIAVTSALVFQFLYQQQMDMWFRGYAQLTFVAYVVSITSMAILSAVNKNKNHYAHHRLPLKHFIGIWTGVVLLGYILWPLYIGLLINCLMFDCRKSVYNQ